MLAHRYTPSRCCPANCRVNTNTQRTLGCSYSLHWHRGWTDTHPHLLETHKKIKNHHICFSINLIPAVRKQHWTTERTILWPVQTSASGSKRYPLGHWQVKLPGVFLHRPFSHSSLFIRHSSISEEKTQTETERERDGMTFLKLAFFFHMRAVRFHFPRGRGHYGAVDLPTQFLPVRSTSKPSLQSHLKVLTMFSHTPFWQRSGSRAHSLMSEEAKNNLLNVTVGKKKTYPKLWSHLIWMF